MNSSKLFHLLRPINLLAIIIIQVVSFYFGGIGSWKHFSLLILLPTILTAAGGYIVNAYFDVHRDAVNGKPQVERKGLMLTYLILNAVALALAFVDGTSLFFTVLALQCVLFLYSWVLSGWPLIGNIAIALISCMVVGVFYFSVEVSLDILNIWVFVISIFLVSLSREMIKDIEDIKGDKESGAFTLPILWGAKMSHIFVDLLLVGNAVFIFSWSYYDFYQENNLGFFIGAFLALFAIGIVIWSHMKKEQYKTMSVLLKVYMFIGLAILPFLIDV